MHSTNRPNLHLIWMAIFFLLGLLLAQPTGVFAQDGVEAEHLLYLPVVSREVNTGVANGDFEAGPSAWVEITETTDTGIVLQAGVGLPIPPRSGEWAAWLGGATARTDALEQEVTVPVAKPYLTYWRRLASQELCILPDVARIRVNGTTVSSQNVCTGTRETEWTQQVVDLRAYAGQQITLRFELFNNSSRVSNFFIDDVDFQSR